MRIHALILASSVMASPLIAEPVFMPQAESVLTRHQTEIGLGGQFGYQISEYVGSPGTTYKNRVWHIPLMVRHAISSDGEARLLIPITRAVDSSEGTLSSRDADTGLGNVQIGGKWNFLKGAIPVAAVLDMDLPTANPRHNAASLGWRYSTQIQQGLNIHPHVVGDFPLIKDRLKAHALVGYMYTGSYKMTSGTRFYPGDLITFSTALELEMKDKVPGISVAAEMLGNTAISHSKTGSTRNSGDRGTVIGVGPSVRYSSQKYQAWTGLLIDAGDATYSAYNYRVHFGAAYRFGGDQ